MSETVNKRYECLLDEKDLAKAVSELNEPSDNDERLRRIDDLRNAFLQQNNDLTLECHDDNFILKFLRARKFNHELALKILTNYHMKRRDWPEVTDKVKSPFLIKHVFDAGCCIGLQGKARDGSGLCIARPGKVNNPLITDFVAAATLSIEHMLEDEKNQIHGITVVEDTSYVSFALVRQLGPSIGKRFISWLQDAMPVRLKAIHIVNQSKLFDVVFAILHPFLKEKMKKRLHLHGSRFEKLHETIDPSVLPTSFGGTSLDLDGNIVNSWRDAILGEGDSL